MPLKGKVALVTGGGRGIGKGIALTLAKAGADVVVADTDHLVSKYNQYGKTDIGGYQDAQVVRREIEALGRKSMALESDVTDWDQVRAMMNDTVEKFGQIDILVNNSGVIHSVFVEQMPEESWDLTMNVNVKGIFLCSKAIIPQMKKQGGGKIINLASIAGKSGSAGLAHYCASKFAVVGFTNALAKELARDNITVNAICPGIVWTQMWVHLSKAFRRPEHKSDAESYAASIEALIPQGREQTAEDMGAMALFFATNGNVTGQSVNVDGGSAIG